MGFPDTACIAFRLLKAVYRPLFELVWGTDFHIRWPGNTEEICATPGGAARFGGSATPIRLSAEDRTKANNIYDHWGQSISKYERSNRLSPFTSKFDAFLKGKYTLTPDEMAGYNLFKGKANCNSCHLDGRSTTSTPGQRLLYGADEAGGLAVPYLEVIGRTGRFQDLRFTEDVGRFPRFLQAGAGQFAGAGNAQRLCVWFSGDRQTASIRS
jgi:hypothetical protein